MTGLGDIFKDYWAVIMTAVGSIAWLVRLESRGLSNEREIRRLWLQRKEDLENANRSREDQSKKLDQMRDDVKEIRSDIKKLLERR